MVVTSCGKNNPAAPRYNPDQGNISFSLSAPEDITSGQVTITKGSLTHVLPVTISNHTGTVTFEGIQVGTWSILVQLFDKDGNEIYTGTGEAVVTKDQTTKVTIRVTETGGTGNLVIIVEVPGATTPTPTPISTPNDYIKNGNFNELESTNDWPKYWENKPSNQGEKPVYLENHENNKHVIKYLRTYGGGGGMGINQSLIPTAKAHDSRSLSDLKLKTIFSVASPFTEAVSQ